VDKSGDGIVDSNDVNYVRDDAAEAGAFTLQLGGGSMSGNPLDPTTVLPRLQADVVLAKFQDAGGRGAVPDTFFDDAFRPTPADANPRSITARESAANGVSNAEVSKRATPVPLFSGAALEPSLDTERNSTTRYQPIQRMANLATTRSNVYAVWITVGFFEVKPAAEDPRIYTRYMNDTNSDNIGDTFIDARLQELFFQVYPDGWTLGEEIGFDTGTNRRHRGFYVVDRSRPVAFRPGEDLNASEAVLVRRRIE